jgi:hypothetical protein
MVRVRRARNASDGLWPIAQAQALIRSNFFQVRMEEAAMNGTVLRGVEGEAGVNREWAGAPEIGKSF